MKQFADGKGERIPKELNPDPVRRARYEEIVKDTIRELYGNARYWDFFKSFNEESVHDFITEYASKKAWYLLNGDRMLSKKEREQFKFRDLAEKCFWEIQQKKLFNMQAEWRAGLIDIEGIEVTRDFYCWEKSITTCPFLEPVTSAELSLYMDYLESGTYIEKSWFYSWQDYESYNHINGGPDATPAWFKYYDSKIGTDYLLMLPDKKGDEEKKYLKSWRNVNKDPNIESINEEEILTGSGPHLYVNYETLDFFINTFENKNLLGYFKASEIKPQDATIEAELQDAFRILNRANETVSLPPDADWRQAVIRGAIQYKIKRILANLPFVFDEYLFRLKTGISLNETEDDSVYQECLAFTSVYRQQVKEGKRIFENQ